MRLLYRLAPWKGILVFIAKMKDTLKIVLCSWFPVVEEGLHAFFVYFKNICGLISLYMHISYVIEPPGSGCCPNRTLMKLE